MLIPATVYLESAEGEGGALHTIPTCVPPGTGPSSGAPPNRTYTPTTGDTHLHSTPEADPTTHLLPTDYPLLPTFECNPAKTIARTERI